MSPEEMRLDMLVAELDYENRLLRARNERLEREAEQRKPRVDLTGNERMSYEELEIDRDRMKTARDSMMLKNADLNANQRKPWVGLTDVEIARVVSLAGFAPDWAEAQIATQIVRVLEQQLHEKNQ